MTNLFLSFEFGLDRSLILSRMSVLTRQVVWKKGWRRLIANSVDGSSDLVYFHFQ
jgi:hypothetical protein